MTGPSTCPSSLRLRRSAITSPTCSPRTNGTTSGWRRRRSTRVTYFFNCGREEPYRAEDRHLVPSQKVATHDLMSEMSAPGIADNLVADLTPSDTRWSSATSRTLHGRAHGSLEGDDCGGGNARRVPGPHPEAAVGRRHGNSHLRPRQCRADVGGEIDETPGAAYGAHSRTPGRPSCSAARPRIGPPPQRCWLIQMSPPHDPVICVLEVPATCGDDRPLAD